MVLTRRMINKTIHREVSFVLRDIISRIVGQKRVYFSTHEVTGKREFLVSKEMKKTPFSKIKIQQLSKTYFPPPPIRCLSLTPEEKRQIQTPILCRTTPIPLSLVWKVANEMKQKNMIDKEKSYRESEKPHFSPSDSDEENLYD